MELGTSIKKSKDCQCLEMPVDLLSAKLPFMEKP